MGRRSRVWRSRHERASCATTEIASTRHCVICFSRLARYRHAAHCPRRSTKNAEDLASDRAVRIVKGPPPGGLLLHKHIALWAAAAVIVLSGCRSSRPCSARSDCLSDEICDANQCVPEQCARTSDCSASDRCDQGRCVMRECLATGDCHGAACIDGACAPCTSASDCGGTLLCNAGACMTRECTTLADCTMGRICNAGLCAPCTADTDCGDPSARACSHGHCVTRECSTNAECTGRELCDQGVCAPCSATLACPNQLACLAGTCSACTMDADCGPGHSCRSGLCFFPCASAADCADPGALGCRDRTGTRSCPTDGFCGGGTGPFPTGAICDACGLATGGCPSGMCDADHRCMCATHADCPAALACTGGRCVACTADADCGCGHYCDAGECHARCGGATDCPGGHCDASTGRCVSCSSDADCSGGQRCYEDGCAGPCNGMLGGGCAPFVTCSATMRCGDCGSCQFGPPHRASVTTCP